MVSLLRRILGGVVGIAATRLELVALEIEHERQRLVKLLFCATLTLFLLLIGLLLGAGWLLLWAPPAQRLLLAGGLTLGFLGAAALAAWRWQRLIQARRPLLGDLLSDLRRAQEGLGGAPRSPGTRGGLQASGAVKPPGPSSP